MKTFLSLILPFVIFTFATQANGQSNHADFKAIVYTTALNTHLRLTKTGVVKLKESAKLDGTENLISVNPGIKFQSILGIGGALTDASAEVFANLPSTRQRQLLTAYYNPVVGIGYTLARTNMNSCDFSSGSYTYVKPLDSLLTSFDISHDKKYRIPLIKRAIDAANGQLAIFISPWSPPAWMKDNNDMLHGGKLLPQYRHSWAIYFTKFIRDYQANKIPIWGLTIQNEPMSSQTWESCIFTASEERDFVRDYLGSELVKEGLGDKKIIVYDHNRDFMYSFSNTILEDTVAAKYIWGTGYHWYESWSDGVMRFGEEKKLQGKYPNNKLLFTEGCIGNFNIKNILDWSNGEHYGYSMINDFNNGTVGWTDWNILLDEHGGPNHVGNFCFAPVHADSKTGILTFTPSYYYIGHFSKFIRPGANRIAIDDNQKKLLSTAFLNTEGEIVIVVMNSSADSLTYKLMIANHSARISSLPHSISTITIMQPKP